MENDSWDANGVFPGALAWVSDLTSLSDEQLHHRIESLGIHIGNCHTVWQSFDGWRAATEARATADEEFWSAVVAALKVGGSICEVAELSGLSTRAVQDWGKAGGWPTAAQKKAREETHSSPPEPARPACEVRRARAVESPRSMRVAV